MNVSWEESSIPPENQKFRYYRLSWSGPQQGSENIESTFYVIPNLTPCKNYEIKVVAYYTDFESDAASENGKTQTDGK